jgi:hypothetical protein
MAKQTSGNDKALEAWDYEAWAGITHLLNEAGIGEVALGGADDQGDLLPVWFPTPADRAWFLAVMDLDSLPNGREWKQLDPNTSSRSLCGTRIGPLRLGEGNTSVAIPRGDLGPVLARIATRVTRYGSRPGDLDPARRG